MMLKDIFCPFLFQRGKRGGKRERLAAVGKKRLMTLSPSGWRGFPTWKYCRDIERPYFGEQGESSSQEKGLRLQEK